MSKLFSSCKHQQITNRGSSILKKIKLGTISTQFFDNFLIIGLDRKWISVNNEKPIEFSVEVKENKLILSGSLERLDRTKDVDTNGK